MRDILIFVLFLVAATPLVIATAIAQGFMATVAVLICMVGMGGWLASEMRN